MDGSRRSGGAVLAAVLLAVAGACTAGGDDTRDDASVAAAPDPTTPATASPSDVSGSTTTQPMRPGSDTSTPTRRLEVTGPITAGRGTAQTSTPVDLAAAGYVEEEFFVSGEATSFTPVGEFGPDGRWTVERAGTAPFTTRVLVRRPADRADANGIVVVEWFNVSSAIDIDVDFVYAHAELLRGGYTWVGVTAQAVSVESDGSTSSFGPGAVGLKAWDADRYGVLAHPGDAYSYDIFTAVGEALRDPGDVDPLAGVAAEHLLAMGESQSGFRLLTYANAVQPLADVYDGILIHSRAGSGAPVATAGFLGGDVPLAARVRDDLDVPVLQVQTETDLLALVPTSPFTAARQADSDTVRTWEVAGTAHSDSYYLRWLSEQGNRQFEQFLDLSAVLGTMNSGPSNYVMNAAIRWLTRWAVDGTAPPAAPPIDVVEGSIVRDADGIATGGVRTPHVDVPYATLTGEGMSMVGMTVPFDGPRLAARYGDEEAFLAQFERSLDTAIAEGFLLLEDRDAILADAAERAAFSEASR